MTGPGFALAAAPEITASSDKEACQHDSEDGGEPRDKAGLVRLAREKPLLDWSSDTGLV